MLTHPSGEPHDPHDVTGGGFSFSFSGIAGNNRGELEGAATTRGGSVFFRDEETNCQVTFARAGARLAVTTSPECSGCCGMGVTFEGEYGKGEPLAGPPPLSASGILAKGVPESAFNALVGADYDLFQKSMERFGPDDDVDGLGMHVVGFTMVMGFKEGEAIVMSRKDGTILAAVVDDLVVKYFSTDPSRARTLPKTIERWREAGDDLAKLKVVYASAR